MTRLVPILFVYLFLLQTAVAQELYTGPLFDTSCQAGMENTKYQGKKKSALFSTLWTEHLIEGGIMFTGVEAGRDDDDDDDDKAGDRKSGLKTAAAKNSATGKAASYLAQLRKALGKKDMVFFLNIGVPGGEGPEKNLKVKTYKKAFKELKLKFKKKKPSTIVRGIGEIQQYDWTEDNFHVDNPLLKMLIDKVLVKNSLPYFMVHFPGGPNSTNFSKLPEIETSHFADLLSAYPDVTFLVHLFLPDFVELADSGGLVQLLNSHQNWIFSVDTGNIMGRWENGIFMCPLMFCCDRDGTCSSNDTDPAPSAVTSFISEYDLKRDEMLAKALEIYRPYIQSYPDRFAWGSENGKLWHLNSEVFSRIIDFSRRFTGSLKADVREDFARGTGRSVFLSK